MIQIENNPKADQLENIVDIREYDVPFQIRVSIDLKIHVGLWYSIRFISQNEPIITCRSDLVDRIDPVVLAFDIETTKLPLKFPDAATDQIMMISYMIDGRGYLITNREIISADVEDFDFTPRPEFPGHFEVFNEPDEISLLRKFFNHIIDVQPQIIVTYNGDFFDWPFVEARAKFHSISMLSEIGFSKDSQDDYQSRCCIHMDCFKWVKRDSYLPIGSQGLKAVAKEKLDYNPIELDPEDMCRFAVEQPQVLSNYSVSDAVATYYLYMKYVHPFIFALCTIIPMEPDAVLRKGSGTLCETLLMVKAYNANVIFPNKQDSVLNKLTQDGHVLNTETYVGASVEALESGIFRADLPCKFKLNSEILQSLIDNVQRTMQRAIEIEEKTPLSLVTNFDEVCNEIIEKLSKLRDCPNRLENPSIYHLDVGAMYPNIILTNRLQPSAIVTDKDCASCDFNKSNSKCKRVMKWTSRVEYMPATKSEFQRIQQQLENEKFLSKNSETSERFYKAFHELSRDEQAEIEKKRLQEYCKRAYKRINVTREEECETIVCQRENAFYVDTVRDFRDRRYEFKNLHKQWKKKLSQAESKNDPLEIKQASNMVVLYESLQLAHKCILNSFYGYVMRRGARWFSMEMAGIVCQTGSSIITRAKELIEKIGRPLELDTDGIWCILPGSFPENFSVKTSEKKLVISYPCAMLNLLIKDFYTNDQYHELIDKNLLKYEIRSENSVFFEVDGPYKAMVLPASKEEGKRIKKRYAVFNFNGSLAELKGFEVKRNGELQLIKIFQSNVFEAFLKGSTLEECYAYVAKVANYWLDILYSKAENMPDNELFDLIAEKRTMSKALEDYGEQKSTSISTAKRLAEFLGDEMVKDKGLNCRYIISKKPEGTTVTERSIPIAIFQAEPSVRKHYLKKWLRASNESELEVRAFLDWEYYIERLNGCIQKIITIPAALQGVPNPVIRVPHPDWLHKKLSERDSTFKQKRIDELFSFAPKPQPPPVMDIEEIGASSCSEPPKPSRTNKRKLNTEKPFLINWREILGNPPVLMGNTKKSIAEWLAFHKRKWQIQIEARRLRKQAKLNQIDADDVTKRLAAHSVANLSTFIQKSIKSRYEKSWEILCINETNQPGVFKMWTLVDDDLYVVSLQIPRIFYVNHLKPLEKGSKICLKSTKHLPRSQIGYHLYEYTIPETMFQKHQFEIMSEFSQTNVEGIYEMNVPLMFRAFMNLGCICGLRKGISKNDFDTFDLNEVEIKSDKTYLESSFQHLKTLYIFAHYSASKQIMGLFIPSNQTAKIFILDTIRTNNMPNLSNLLNVEKEKRLKCGIQDDLLPELINKFEVKVETNLQKLYKALDRSLSMYKDEKRGSTMIALQSNLNDAELISQVPTLDDFPLVKINIEEKSGLFNVLDWQKVAAKHMISHYMNLNTVIKNMLEQSRYFQLPLGNLPKDAPLFACDLFYARHLIKNNCILWCSSTSFPDLGGKQYDDFRLVQSQTITGDSAEDDILVNINFPGFYQNACLDISLENLSISALLQLNKINEYDGASSTNFSSMPEMNIASLISGETPGNIYSSYYDEATLIMPSLKILRTMIQYWLRDVASFGNAFADLQIIHFYRWLQSPHSLLYDPALKRTLQTYMKKLCLLLVTELKKLGANIVYANLNRIILSTKKYLYDDSLGFFKYLTNNIQNIDIFSTVHVELSKVWKILLWQDVVNYGGFKIDYREDEENEEEANSQSLDKDNEETIEMNWKLSEFLPKVVQENFTAIIAGYLGSIYEVLKEDSIKKVASSQVEAFIQETQSTTQSASSNKVVQYSRELLSGELTEQLLRITQKIYKKLTDEDFPELFGCKYKLRCPALEFVKYICKILLLDRNIDSQVTKLKRDLFTIINVREFSDEAQFVDPSLSLVIPQILCLKCNQCKDLDLCRDPCSNLNTLESSNDKDDDTPRSNNQPIGWYCSECNHFYNLKYIEFYLIEILHSKMISFVTQDIKCSKCNEVRGAYLQRYCECTGDYLNACSNNELNILIKTLNNFIAHVKLPRLAKELEFLVGHTPWLNSAIK